MRSRHPTAEQIAALIERGLSAEEKSSVEHHLVRCRACMAAYADGVRLRTTTSLPPDHRDADAQLHALITADVIERTGRLAEASPRRTGRSRVAWPAVAALVVFLAGGAWYLNSAPPGPDEPAAWAIVIADVAHDASHDGMILPGQARKRHLDRPVVRSAGHRGELDEVLAGVVATGPASGDDRLLLACGHLATGDLHTVRLLAIDGLRDEARLASWLVLSAIVAYRDNDLDRAETYLTRALAASPMFEEARFNLGLLRSARGDTLGARALFGGLLADDDDALITVRARRELAALDSPRR